MKKLTFAALLPLALACPVLIAADSSRANSLNTALSAGGDVMIDVANSAPEAADAIVFIDASVPAHALTSNETRDQPRPTVGIFGHSSLVTRHFFAETSDDLRVVDALRDPDTR